MNNNPIGLFDSGVGGLSILLEIKKILPKENFVFFADQENMPYGSKTKRELISQAEKITNFLQKHKIKLLVIACNTATCYTLQDLRSKFNLPIVGTVPAIKPAAKLYPTQFSRAKIIVMSTPATAKSTYLDNLIKEFCQKRQVAKIGCPNLEEAIENFQPKKISKLLDKYMSEIKKNKPSTIILGCTHYPLIKSQIKEKVGPKVKVIDSGVAIAKQVKALLEKEDSLSAKKTKDLFFTTKKPQNFAKVASIFLKYGVKSQRAQI